MYVVCKIKLDLLFTLLCMLFAKCHFIFNIHDLRITLFFVDISFIIYVMGFCQLNTDVVMVVNKGRGANIDMFDELKRGGAHVYHESVTYRRFKKMILETEPKYGIVLIVNYIYSIFIFMN